MSVTAGEPALSWFCPACGHVWISVVGINTYSHRWRCSCGYDTKKATRARNVARHRERRKQAA